MVSETVLQLCQGTQTVSSEYAKDPTRAPGDIVHELFRSAQKPSSSSHAELGNHSATLEDLERVRQCGQWGPVQPSELFLRAYDSALSCLDADPMANVVSPALMGSYGTIPLTVIAPLADIIRHMSNLIVRAEKEVFLATCSWSPSVGQRLISDALRELSRRAGLRGERVVVKVMYDKAGAANFAHSHVHVKPEAFAGEKIQLPHPSDIPNIDFQVVSMHKPLLGTLHAKFMVVDRKIAVIESNNMEDNTNMEMMTHLEGPIVDSIYDSALITWKLQLDPSLPSLNKPAAEGGLASETAPGDQTFHDAREQHEIANDGKIAQLPEHEPGNPHYDPDTAAEITRMQSVYSAGPNESTLQAISRRLNLACAKDPAPATGPEIQIGEEFTPYIPVSTNSPFPIALVSRPPYGAPNNHSGLVPQNQAWLGCIRNAQKSIFIQTPDLNAVPLYEALATALGRGVEVTYYVCLGYNDAGELMPGQGGTNEMFATKLTSTLTQEQSSLLHIYYYVAKDQDHPIHHTLGQRSCHIKLLIADGHVAIQGSGNQDTQSWFHSQEMNVMIDNEEICRKWREGIERNQNTAKFGKAGKDGVWRDANGNVGAGSTGTPSAPVGWFKGVIGMYKKAQAKGGL
jgi:phosphatidylserine/phosphatidylglycerophosphate/cardiolipin synthase-like enzyme